MSESQSINFNLVTKEGARLELFAEGLTLTQMNNILNNIIKPNIAPLIPTMKGKIRMDRLTTSPRKSSINEVIQGKNKDIPVLDLDTNKIVNEHQEEAAEKLKAEEMNDLAIQNKDVSVITSALDKPKTSILDRIGQEKLQELYNQTPPELVEAEGEPDFYHTGIKYTNDKPRYRTFYECPRCGQSGRHYIPKNITQVACHNCQSQLEVVPATDKGFGHGEKFRDDYGNFFVAKTLVIDKNKLYERS
jgi:hypothetical protein